MDRIAFALAARVVAAVFTAAVVASCGSGAVSGSSTSGPPQPITITPATATLYSDLPTTFFVTGGNGSYLVSSSDQAAVPVSGSFTGTTLVVVPNPVAADVPVTLTVRDTASTTPATAALTVKPRTVSNVVTITPSASQSAACGTAICSGGDAEVRVVLRQNGIPLRGRTVRFDIVSGDVRFITSPPGLPESLALSQTTVSDDNGIASVRVRVLSDATAQTALLQVTDVSSGFTQRASVTVAPGSNAPLNAQPNTIVFKGVAANTCASGISADVIVFGGRPPYLISQPGSFQVAPTIITSSPGRFTVTAIGQCSAGSQIAVVDGNGATVSVNASNTLSDVAPPAAPTPVAFSIAPTQVTLNSCTDTASVSLVGGSGNYYATSGSSQVYAAVNGTTGIIRRAGTGAATTPVNVAFSDGQSNREVVVTLSGLALTGPCP